MSFEMGSISCRIFYVPHGLPDDVLSRFATNAAPPIDTLGTTELSGWVTGRHLLDRNITEENAYYAGRLRLTLMKAERKIPASLLWAERKIEELAELQATNKEFLTRERRMEIKEQVTERLLPDMPPTLGGIPTVYDQNEKLLYAGAMSLKQVDALIIHFEATTGSKIIPMTANTAAAKMARVNPEILEPTSFSPDLEDPLAGNAIGQDFLTWLWFYSEARGGIMAFEGVNYGVVLEGPLTFYMEGDGAHVTSLSKGAPEISTEAKTCLMSGKKLLKAKVTIGGGEHESWSFAIDANEFTFRSLKMQKGEELDAQSKFEQRMLSLDKMRKVFLSFYERFLSERINPNAWKPVQADIHKWVADRKTKR